MPVPASSLVQVEATVARSKNERDPVTEEVRMLVPSSVHLPELTKMIIARFIEDQVAARKGTFAELVREEEGGLLRVVGSVHIAPEEDKWIVPIKWGMSE